MQCNSEPVTTLSLRRPEAADETALPQRIGDYAITRCLGSGGMGVVYEGRHLFLERWAAIKMARRDLPASEHVRTRLLREARALARIQHPHVVAIYELGRADDAAFFAMELVPGMTLREWIRAPHPTAEVVEMFLAIGEALVAVHAEQLVHRDVNPSNVFVGADGVPKLGDFGLVANANESDDHVVGTQPYMAPEQSLGEPVDPRSDQYAFCVSLHEALVGEYPDVELPSALPRPLRSLLARGLSVAPDLRFPSMRDLVTALGEACASRSGSSGRRRAGHPWSRSRRPSPCCSPTSAERR